jgi:hypothetical protein
MSRTPTVHSLRQRSAVQAYRALGPSPSEKALLVVRCARSHHVAAVYDAPTGPVYRSVPWAHGHGERDRHDAAHHGGHRADAWFDWLRPGRDVDLDDALPAGCECGARTLSRRLLLKALDAGDRRMVID